jgi:hypothetical protein
MICLWCDELEGKEIWMCEICGAMFCSRVHLELHEDMMLEEKFDPNSEDNIEMRIDCEERYEKEEKGK